MFDLEIVYEDIFISSIQKEDLPLIQNWLKKQVLEDPEDRWVDADELEKRFIEYYLSENEFFGKVIKGDSIIGVIKGRVEFKNPNEVLLWCFVIDNNIRAQGVGSHVLKEVIRYFESNFGIHIFSTGIVEGSRKTMNFWNKNGFKLHRVSKSFFNHEGKDKDMFILKKNEKVKIN